MFVKIGLFILLNFVIRSSKCAEILAVIPSPFYSHQATWRPLWTALAKNGHHITLMTTDLMQPNENITQIDISVMYKIMKENDLFKMFSGDAPFDIFKIPNLASKIMEDTWELQIHHPEFKKIEETGVKFDLLFVEMLVPGFSFWSYKYKCPFIGLTSMDAHPRLHNLVGNSIHPALYPFADLGFPSKLSFKQRILSTMLHGALYITEVLYNPYLNAMGRKYIAEDVPPIDELNKNMSLLFSNANPIFFPNRPIVPTTVNLEGGMHLMKPKPLPKELQTFLDASKNGCIYVSFGSTIEPNALKENALNDMVTVFKELYPIKVLWKFKDPSVLKSKPSNIKFVKWVPQQDVLRHSNVKLFITQGGLQSMEEAINSAVPMLGISFYGDQIHNVNKMNSMKFGLKLEKTDLTKESFKKSILEVINNPIYKETIENLSKISKDRPMGSLEKAVWWTEYLIRHKNTLHLRSPSADIPLYQYFYLDILLLVFSVLAVLFYTFKILLFTVKFILRKLRKQKVKTN